VLRAINNGEDEDEDGETIVYGCCLFEDGQYGNNTNLWDVTLKQSSNNVCRLADLRDCHICVGGGFPVASLDDNLANSAIFEGWIDGDESDEGEESGDTCKVSFCFSPHTIWLTLFFLVEDVVAQYPDATVEFKNVIFVTGSIHGALKRLLPPKRKEEVRADRDRRRQENNPESDALYQFVSRTMRERGNDAHRTLFLPQLYLIVGFLSAMGIDRLGENDEFIMTAIETHAQHGDVGLRDLFDQHGPDVMDEDEGNEEE